MNLKEAFRYQNFLDRMMAFAKDSISTKDHALKTTETHFCSAANPDAKDRVEEVDKGEFHKNDDVLRLGLKLIEEKNALSYAITQAKLSSGVNIDAEIETNKFRQQMVAGLKYMLGFKPGKRKSQARGYKFDINQAQVPYIYDMEILDEDNFDRSAAKEVMRRLVDESDAVSTKVEMALVNTNVDYVPPFNVNDTFDDVMQEFLAG